MSEPFDPYHKWLGIPPAEQPPQHYRLLGIGLFEEDPDVIEQAADRQMAHVQTHKTGPHSALSQKLLNELSSAKLCLLKREAKDAYDARLRAQLGAKQPLPKARSLPAAAVAVVPVDRPPAIVDLVAVRQTASAIAVVTRRRSRKPVWQQPAVLALAALAVLGVVAGAVWLTSGDTAQVAQPGSNLRPAPAVKPTPRHDDSATRTKKKPARAVQDTASAAGPIPPSGTKLVPAPAPAVEELSVMETVELRPRETVDLLKLIDIRRDTLASDWRFDDGRLICPEAGRPRLELPLATPEAYMLTLVAQWKARAGVPERLHIGLPVGSSHVTLDLGGFQGDVNGLHTLDGKGSDANETTRRGRLLPPDRPNTLVCTVRNGSIHVTCNGEIVVDWHGDPKRLGHESRNVPRDPSRLFLQSEQSGFEVTRLELTRLADGVAGPADGKPGTSGLRELSTSAPKKQPVPSEDERKVAEKKVRTMFNDLRSSKAPEAKMKRSRFLAAKARQSGDSPVEQYVMYDEALQLAVEGGDYSSAVAVIMELAERFDVEASALRCDALARVNRSQRGAAQKAVIVDAALELIAEAVRDDDYATADQVVKLATASARLAKDRARAEQVATRAKDVAELSREFEKLADFRRRVDETPGDPEANLAVGLYDCVFKRDWQRGLPRLAVSGDEALKQAALADLAAPVDTAARVAVGQRWLTLAEQSDGETKVCHQVRAWYWFILARHGLAQPNRAEIDERISKLEGGAAFEARRRQWLERLGIGLKHEGEIDCAAAAQTFQMAEAFDLARSWKLSLEFQPGSVNPDGQVFFWGDDRGGRDPLFVRLGDAHLELGIGDSHDPAKAHSIRPPLRVLDGDRWLHLEVTYQSSDRALVIELEHERIATGVCPFEPAADRPMPIWIGGASADSQRFTGKVRMVTLRN